MDLRTLTFTPSTVTRTAMTASQQVEYYTSNQITNRWRRPAYRFALEFDVLTRQQVDCLTALHAYHQGDKPFWWNGGAFGQLEYYALFGDGDGRKTSFYLPHRHVSSFSIRSYRPATGATSVRVTGIGVTSATGQVDFNVAVTSGDEAQARYCTRYRLNFDPNGIKVDQLASRDGGLFRVELVLTENTLDDP